MQVSLTNEEATGRKMKVDKHFFSFPEEGFPFRIDPDVPGAQSGDYSRFYHLHPLAIEFQYIRSGNGFYFIKNRRYPLHPKALFIIHGHDTHSYIKDKAPLLLNKTSLHFSKTLFKDFPSFLSLSRNITICRRNFSHQIHFNEKEAVKVELLLERLQGEWRKKEVHYRKAIINELLRFFILITRARKSKSTRLPGEYHPLIDEALTYIDTHFKENITLPLLSEHLYRSPCHISHLFKKFAGPGFKEYLTHKRITEARRLLKGDSTRKILAVALEVGFSDLSTFNRAFKRLAGMNPSQYRKFCLPFRK